MELKYYLSVLWKWKWLILVATLLAGGLSYWTHSQELPTYQTTTTVRVGQLLESTDPRVGDIATSQQLAQLYAESVRRRPIMEATVDTLGLGAEWQRLAENVYARAVDRTQLLQISVQDNDPERAKAIADEIARQLVLQSPTSQEAELEQDRQFVAAQLTSLRAKIENAEAEIGRLEGDLDQEVSARAIQDIQDQTALLEAKIRSWQSNYTELLDFYKGSRTNFLSVVEPAPVPITPLGPGMLYYVLIAVAVGFALAGGAALLMEYLDESVSTEEGVERAISLPTLGSISDAGKPTDPAGRLIGLSDPQSPIAEAYRILRANVQFMALEDKPLMLMITSAAPDEGKTTIAANLAVAFAQSGKRTVLVDADLRRPTVRALFQSPGDAGLTSLFLLDSLGPRARTPNPPPPVESYLVATQEPLLRVLPSGPIPPNPSELLGSERMDQILRVLRKVADVVIVDTAPLLAVSDPAVLASKSLRVVLVAEAGRTQTKALRAAKEVLVRAHAKFAGAVLNKVPTASHPYYKYRYYQQKDGEPSVLARLFGRRSPNQGAGRLSSSPAVSTVTDAGSRSELSGNGFDPDHYSINGSASGDAEHRHS